jgi:hypothetical protein
MLNEPTDVIPRARLSLAAAADGAARIVDTGAAAADDPKDALARALASLGRAFMVRDS